MYEFPIPKTLSEAGMQSQRGGLWLAAGLSWQNGSWFKIWSAVPVNDRSQNWQWWELPYLWARMYWRRSLSGVRICWPLVVP